MDHVYPVTEIYGSSTESIDDVIRSAVSSEHQMIRNIEWFEVTDIHRHIGDDASVGHFQVGVKLEIRLEKRTQPAERRHGAQWLRLGCDGNIGRAMTCGPV